MLWAHWNERPKNTTTTKKIQEMAEFFYLSHMIKLLAARGVNWNRFTKGLKLISYCGETYDEVELGCSIIWVFREANYLPNIFPEANYLPNIFPEANYLPNYLYLHPKQKKMREKGKLWRISTVIWTQIFQNELSFIRPRSDSLLLTTFLKWK